MEVLIWMLTAGSIVGVILNVQKNRYSFLIWMVTNASWAIVDFAAGIPQQGCLFVIYFCLAVWGWISWRPEVKSA